VTRSLARRVEEFSGAFDVARPIWDRRQGLCIDYRFLSSKPFDALMFFTLYAHERPFANPRYPVAHRIAILKAIGASDAKGASVNRKHARRYCEPGFAQAVWKEFKTLLTQDEGKEEARKTLKNLKKYTRGPVLGILKMLTDERQPNIVVLLTSMKLREAYELLNHIDWIGHKIAALFLRDVRGYCGGWPQAEEGDLFCLQPVDRWVGRLAVKCWEDLKEEKNPEKMAREIVKRCGKEGVDPIRFNKGAWLLGAHSQKLCGFFNIRTTMRLSDMGTLIDRFDPSMLKKAIETLGKAENAAEVYSP
jgi:hypothetical protein